MVDRSFDESLHHSVPLLILGQEPFDVGGLGVGIDSDQAHGLCQHAPALSHKHRSVLVCSGGVALELLLDPAEGRSKLLPEHSHQPFVAQTAVGHRAALLRFCDRRLPGLFIGFAAPSEALGSDLAVGVSASVR